MAIKSITGVGGLGAPRPVSHKPQPAAKPRVDFYQHASHKLGGSAGPLASSLWRSASNMDPRVAKILSAAKVSTLSNLEGHRVAVVGTLQALAGEA